MKHDTAKSNSRRMTKPGLPMAIRVDISWALSGIQGEMEKLKYMSPELQRKRGKPGSPVSICVIKIASLVKGCPEIQEEQIRASVWRVMSSWEFRPARHTEFNTIWVRAMDNCKGRRRNG